MGILGEQSILTKLDGYINENYIFEEYSFQPVGEYDVESNISFKVYNNDDHIASVKITKIDGESVDAINDDYDYRDVYADITLELEGKEDEYDVEAVKKWILEKLSSMGYDKNPAKIDDEEYDVTKYKKEISNEPEEDELDNVKGDVETYDDTKFSLDDIEESIEDEIERYNIKIPEWNSLGGTKESNQFSKEYNDIPYEGISIIVDLSYKSDENGKYDDTVFFSHPESSGHYPSYDINRRNYKSLGELLNDVYNKFKSHAIKFGKEID